jgi:hypothetical protein
LLFLMTTRLCLGSTHLILTHLMETTFLVKSKLLL